MTEFKPPTWEEDTDRQIARLLVYVITALALIIFLAACIDVEIGRLEGRVAAIEGAQKVRP